jgi:long-chain acyl-CoA synthetase
MRNFPTHFWQLFQERKDETAFEIVAEDGTTATESYWEWTRRVQRIAVAFYESDLEAGDRVGLIVPNRQEWYDLAFGIWLAGGVVVPLSPEADRSTLLKCLGRSGCRWIVAANGDEYQRIRGQGTQMPDDLSWMVVEWDGETSLGDATTLTQFLEKGRSLVARGRVDDLAERIYNIEASAPAVVLFEHPPGDDPHGAFFEGDDLAEMLDGLGSSLPFGADARPAVLRSLADPRASLVAVATLLEGRTLGVGRAPNDLRTRLDDLHPTHLLCDADYLVETTRRWRDRIEQAPEFMQGTEDDGEDGQLGFGSLLSSIGERAAERLFYQPLRNTFGGELRAFLLVGPELPADVEKVIESSETSVLDVYGHPECGVSHLEQPGSRKPGAVGRPVHGYKCRIDEPNDDGVGEVLIASEFLFEDYWDGSGPKTIEDGWLYTGDLGRIDNGRLYLE